MNNHRLLTGLLAAALWSGGMCAAAQNRQVLTIDRLFEIAEANSAQLRPSIAAAEEADREISVARSSRLPDIEANLSLSYIGDGFTRAATSPIISGRRYPISATISASP